MRLGRFAEAFTITVDDEKVAELRNRLGDRRLKWIWDREKYLWLFRSGLVKIRISSPSRVPAHFRGRLTADGTMTGTIRESFFSLLWTWLFAVPATFALLFGLFGLVGLGLGHPAPYIVTAVSVPFFWVARRAGRSRPTDFAEDADDMKQTVHDLFGRRSRTEHRRRAVAARAARARLDAEPTDQRLRAEPGQIEQG